jgi:outer membrane scaffolding protein for murein synthesis (MipA/OmpV family)
MRIRLIQRLVTSTLAMSGLATAAAAQEIGQSQEPLLTQPQYVLHLGVAGQYKPSYPGASKYLLSPVPLIEIDRLYVPGFGQVVDGTVKTRGFSVYPSFSINGERTASDSNDLTGTTTIDLAVEAGLGLRYRHDWLRGFAEIRQGFGGHSGQVGTVGLDIIAQPTERLELTFGPRLDWGSDNYNSTYFGVTAAEAAAVGSTLTAYSPGAGINSVGLDLKAKYAYSDRTTLHLRAGWDRFVGDTADSPIVTSGSENQFTIGLGISYRFDFDLFD